jgi:hypothetical protein
MDAPLQRLAETGVAEARVGQIAEQETLLERLTIIWLVLTYGTAKNLKPAGLDLLHGFEQNGILTMEAAFTASKDQTIAAGFPYLGSARSHRTPVLPLLAKNRYFTAAAPTKRRMM